VKPVILVVDDEESLRYTFECFLTSTGYDVSVASTYIEALKAISEESFDLIFADIILGNRTGIDLLRKIKERDRTIPVIMVTGYPSLETAAEAVRLGAFDYISKPLEKEEFLRAAAKALDYKFLLDDKERYRRNLEAIFKSVKDGIITVDREGFITELNEAAKKICGFTKYSIGEPFETLIKGSRSTNCIQALKECIKNKQTVELSRVESHLPDNETKIISVTISPLISQNQEYSGSVMVVRDDTPLVKLESFLQEKQKYHNIIGKSDKIQKIYSFIEELPPTGSNVIS